jgi:hypothetical protein
MCECKCKCECLKADTRTDEVLIRQFEEARKQFIPITEELRRRGYDFKTSEGWAISFPRVIFLYRKVEEPVTTTKTTNKLVKTIGD